MKLCINCMHIRKTRSNDYICNMAPAKVSMVTGKPLAFYDAEKARNDEAMCGVQAKWYAEDVKPW